MKRRVARKVLRSAWRQRPGTVEAAIVTVARAAIRRMLRSDRKGSYSGLPVTDYVARVCHQQGQNIYREDAVGYPERTDPTWDRQVSP